MVLVEVPIRHQGRNLLCLSVRAILLIRFPDEAVNHENTFLLRKSSRLDCLHSRS